MKFGNLDIKGIYVGSTPAAQMCLGDVKAWPEEEPAPVADWLCFTAQQANSTVRLDKSSSSFSSVSLETSYDGSSWTDYNWNDITGDTLTLANAGDKVYMRAKDENLTFSTYASAYYKFVMTGKIAASGNIQTLLKADGSRIDVQQYSFYNLFYNCSSLTTAPKLPATTLASCCYYDMFAYCTSLSSAPALPATTLATGCYIDMFLYCTSLSSAPALPATTLAATCYGNMFRGCSSLTQAPALPATALAATCYGNMFQGCTSLTQAPALPATTLARNCYSYMFYGCTSLTSAPELPATSLVSCCYNTMFYGCTSLTSAPELPATSLVSCCYNTMFYGCTSLTQAPALPATTLATSCYASMFNSCSSLTQAPALPATTLATGCYGNMFRGCSSLSSIDVNFTAWSPSNATNNWLNTVSSSGTFTCPTALGTNETIERGASNCPTGWTVINTDA